MADFRPSAFHSHIKGKDGLARPCRFEVVLPLPTYINGFVENSVLDRIINIPRNFFSDIASEITGKKKNDSVPNANPTISRYLGMQCESAELPGKTLMTQDVKIYGPTFKVPYQKQFSDINLTFLCTNEFYERKLFERWIEAIMPSDTNNLRYAKDNETRYMTNIKIIQYDDFIRQIYAVELIDAFPIGIAPAPLAWSDEGFHRLGVQFAYQKYRVIYDGNYNLTEMVLQTFGSKASDWLQSKTGGIDNTLAKVFDKII